MSFLTVLFILSQAALSSAWAKSEPKSEPKSEVDIPQKPTTPPSLTRQSPVDSFQCERSFTYRGKVLSCDTYVRRDGEQLRPIIRDVPEAVSELNIYQKNRRIVQNTAYISAIGLAIAAGGFLVSRQITQDDGKISLDGIAVRNMSVIGGVGLSVGSLLYGFSLLSTNETHLGNAVDAYNKARPNDPIELQFSTSLTF